MLKSYFAPTVDIFAPKFKFNWSIFGSSKKSTTTNKTENFNEWNDRSTNIDAIGSDVVNLAGNSKYIQTDKDSIAKAFDFADSNASRSYSFADKGLKSLLGFADKGLKSLLGFADKTINTAAIAINNAGVISQNKEALSAAKPTQSNPLSNSLVGVAIAGLGAFLLFKKLK